MEDLEEGFVDRVSLFQRSRVQVSRRRRNVSINYSDSGENPFSLFRRSEHKPVCAHRLHNRVRSSNTSLSELLSNVRLDPSHRSNDVTSSKPCGVTELLLNLRYRPNRRDFIWSKRGNILQTRQLCDPTFHRQRQRLFQ